MTAPDPIAATRALGVAAALAGQPRTAPAGLTAWEAVLWLSGWDAGALVPAPAVTPLAPLLERLQPGDQVLVTITRRGPDDGRMEGWGVVDPHVGMSSFQGALSAALWRLEEKVRVAHAALARGRAAFAEHVRRERSRWL